MKFTAATALAALAAVVSGAAIQRRGTDLPARFTLEIVSDDPVVGGLHVRYSGGKFLFTPELAIPELTDTNPQARNSPSAHTALTQSVSPPPFYRP